MFDQLQQVINEFLLDGEARGHSAYTTRAYRNAFRFFTEWLAERKVERIGQLTPSLLREYAVHCSATLSPGGAHARLRPIKTLLKWAQQEELISQDLTRRLPMPKLLREPLPAVRFSDFQKLLGAAKVKSRCPLRDVALLTVLYDTGLRASEALALQLDDIRPEGFILVRQGKGGKSRSVPIERPTLKAIRAYVHQERHEEPVSDALFLAGDRAMSRGTLDKMLERLCEFAGLPRLSAHTFRRGFAVQYLRNGGDVFTLQRIFGHTSLEMTNRYAQLLDDDVKLAHRRSSPLRSRKE
ncbi:site-specific recombinase XerD [Deinococcus sp. HSC-46F16]|uniref:tyrosine-type recombinase/integrase n=1 Tax=Deinococcus sp. HSC-46F16 TaxID=2910968 RepID=UPI00209DAEDB|nr:tyrosine-type recombinase/integrase [Deinococcus sp. HSC-46F16]MCP2013225.1 site-specific recombinase XerD [Deinococcus sp. HSC-46F16]